jgi:hypothetical protein
LAGLLLIFLALSFFRQLKWLILAAWLCWLFFLEHHGGINDVSTGYLGWMALSHAWLHPSDPDLEDKLGLYRYVAWVVFGVSYSASGLHKWRVGPSWQDGSALQWVMRYDLFVRPWGAALAQGPAWLCQVLTWTVLGAESTAALFCLIPRLRWVSWGALTLMHLGIALCLDFGVLSLAMLVFHFWIYAACAGSGTQRSLSGSWNAMSVR